MAFKMLQFAVVLETLLLNVDAQYKFGTPNNGLDDWTQSYARAQEVVSQMTLEEMNNITIGFDDNSNGCVGVSGGAPRLGYPGMCLQDAGNGIRQVDGVSAFASGVSVGASWNTELTYQRAVYMGAENKRKGINVILGPVVGPIGRTPTGGRNWEGFGADPYLDGILGAISVEGLQKSVIASIKHYVGNEQETNRNPEGSDPEILASSSNIDDKTMHEVYAWPFADMINAGAACTMCSYQRINQTYGCENNETLNRILKEEMGFKGFVVSDWGAQHSGLRSAVNGLDMVMPVSPFWSSGRLVEAVENGTLDRAVLEDKALRTLAAWFQVHQDDESQPPLGFGVPVTLLEPHELVDARDPESKANILQQAIEGHVLVKNVNNALPLKKPRVMSIYGYDAVVPLVYGPTGEGGFQYFMPDWQSTNLTIDQNARPQAVKGLLTTGGGSGSSVRPYVLSPYDVLAARAEQDGTVIYYDFLSTNPLATGSTEACLVFINEYATEGFDRPGLADPESDKLVNNVAANCTNTIVVIHNSGIRIVDSWIENPNITAVLFAHLPGQDAGRALDKILYGEVSPSGRLPYTVAKKAADYGDLLDPCPNADDSTSPQCDYTEGVNIDYRSFLARDVEPRYAFGYGLTYSNFSYANLAINVNRGGEVAEATASQAATGQNSGLFDQVGTVTVQVTNTGSVAAAEVVQLYLQIPGADTKALRGFKKVLLQPGQSEPVTFGVRKKDISSWNTVTQAWEVPEGTFEVSVGKSVLDVILTGKF